MKVSRCHLTVKKKRMSPDVVFIIGAVVFAVAGVVLLYLGKAPNFLCTRSALVALILVALYVSNALDYFKLNRSDGNEVYALIYFAYTFAVYLISTFFVAHKPEFIHDITWFPVANIVWVLLHFGSAIADTNGVRVWLFVLGIVAWMGVMYIMYLYTKSMNDRSYIDMPLIMGYGVITLVIHVGFVLGQNGTGIIGPLGTAIWYLVTDFFLFILFGSVGISFLVDHHNQIERKECRRPDPCPPKYGCDTPPARGYSAPYTGYHVYDPSPPDFHSVKV